MKNIFKATLAVAAIAAVGMGSYRAYDSYVASNMSTEDLLFAENVEALSMSDNDASKKDENPTCGTKETTIFRTVCTVPRHYELVGFGGTEYSYNAIGTDLIYYTGFVGSTKNCKDCQYGPPMDQNTKASHDCPKNK